jgi:exodeoxyribonuclease VII large subunit
VSYRAVLERGFTLVRGADGRIRRRAQEVVAAERLKLTFADDSVEATAGEAGAARPAPAAARKGKGPAGGQGTLF